MGETLLGERTPFEVSYYPPWRNPWKGRDQILPSGNLALEQPSSYPWRNKVFQGELSCRSKSLRLELRRSMDLYPSCHTDCHTGKCAEGVHILQSPEFEIIIQKQNELKINDEFSWMLLTMKKKETKVSILLISGKKSVYPAICRSR